MAAERADREHGRKQKRNRQDGKNLFGKIEDVRQRDDAGPDATAEIGVELVGQIDHDDQDREAEQRDEEHSTPFTEQVAVEGTEPRERTRSHSGASRPSRTASPSLPPSRRRARCSPRAAQSRAAESRRSGK